jgi:hypothetical protein
VNRQAGDQQSGRPEDRESGRLGQRIAWAHLLFAREFYQKRHDFVFIHFEVPFVLGHRRYDRSPFAVIGATSLDDLHLPLQMSFFNRLFQLLIQMFATAFLAFAPTADVENALGGICKIFRHTAKLTLS